MLHFVIRQLMQVFAPLSGLSEHKLAKHSFTHPISPPHPAQVFNADHLPASAPAQIFVGSPVVVPAARLHD
ncbi:MAG: hypothetical protein DYH12_18580 [Sorangiineae bacterium PRO1]|nr:hypothetical protein [Sorangiineae bacterium PRO1]